MPIDRSNTLPFLVNERGQLVTDTGAMAVDMPIAAATSEDVRLINIKLDKILELLEGMRE